MSRTIVHVAQIEITPESGMGRVAWHWRRELEARGYTFVHLGPSEVGRVHPALFPWRAYRRFRGLGVRPAAVLVHEPAGLPFVLGERGERRRTLVFSHGLERRGWEATLELAAAGEIRLRARSRLLFPLWRLRPADAALRRARAVLVLNREDLAWMLELYGRRPEEVHLFRNGVDPMAPLVEADAAARPVILFTGSWIARKGIRTLAAAAGLLSDRGLAPRFLLAGTSAGAETVLADWPAVLRDAVTVVPRFAAAEEEALHAGAGIFVLPSTFEGQPLSLLQAMAAGRCCVVSDIGAHRDLIADHETGLLHRPGDAGDLAARLAECLESPALRRELGERARLAVQSRTWEAVSRDVADFIERTIGREDRA